MSERAVVLVSGGLDSATTLAIAIERGFECYALTFEYGQRHHVEVTAAGHLAATLGAAGHRIERLDLGSLGGSALTDRRIAVPEQPGDGIPVTYVPARNTVLLAHALAWAEVLESDHVFIGVTAIDYSGYPDCRREYLDAFETMANLATKRAVEGRRMHIESPLVALGKAEIIRRGIALGVDYAATVSCYQPDSEARACGRCDSCRLRRAGFEAAGVADPTRYAPECGA